MHRWAFRGSSCCRATEHKGGSDIAVRGRRPGRRSNVAVENEAGLNTAQLGGPSSGQAPQRLKGTCQQRLPANQQAGASYRQHCERFRSQGKDESFTATMHIGPTCHLPAHFQKGTPQSIGRCTISSRRKVSCSPHELWSLRETSNFPLWDQRINRGVLPGNVPYGNPLDVFLSIPQAISLTGGGAKGTTLTRVCSSNTFRP
jgi:hypothetical protein